MFLFITKLSKKFAKQSTAQAIHNLVFGEETYIMLQNILRDALCIFGNGETFKLLLKLFKELVD